MYEIYIPSENIVLCARLEHDWLKNYLQRQINAERKEWLGRKSGAPLPRVIAGIPPKVEEVTRLLKAAVVSSSPSQLIDKTPLADFPSEIREVICEAAHQAYLDLGIIQPLISELELSSAAFEKAAAQFVVAWQSEAGRSRLAATLNGLEESAIRLRKSLLSLPREILLP
jgi:hypothetical protein